MCPTGQCLVAMHDALLRGGSTSLATGPGCSIYNFPILVTGRGHQVPETSTRMPQMRPARIMLDTNSLLGVRGGGGSAEVVWLSH